ncbi:hypothetical protein WEI85_35715 [Actinomycetes bacterium KLBMP 9797]
MRPRSEIRVPIRITVTGRLGDDDLARLESAVATMVARRLTGLAAGRATGPVRPAATPSGALMAAPPGVPVDGEIEIPSYQGPPGAKVRVPVRGGGAGGSGDPGAGASDQIHRWATEQEAAEHASAEADAIGRSFRPRFDHEVRSAAADAARATSDSDLAARIRRTLHGSHAIQDARDAERFIDLAVADYGRRHQYSSDVVFALALGLKREYTRETERAELAARRQRVDDLTREIADDPYRQENLRWRDRVAALAAEFGMDYGFVDEFLQRFHQSQPFPGRAAVPRFLRIYEPLAPLVELVLFIKNLVPGVGLLEGIAGRDILTGRRLATWERALGITLDLIPLAGKAVRPLGTAVRIAGRAGRATVRMAVAAGRGAADWAVTAVRLGVGPEVMLRHIGRLSRLDLDRVRHLHQRIAHARRTGTAVRLTDEEHRLLRELDDAHAELRGRSTADATAPAQPRPERQPASRPAADATAPPPRAAAPARPVHRARRQLTPEQIAQARAVHPALPGLLERYPKVTLDTETLAELGQLLTSTGRSRATYVRTRAASGELAVLDQLHRSDSVQSIGMLRPAKGRRTPDFTVLSTAGERFQVEVTTPTLARRGQRGPARAGDGGARVAPPVDRTREPTSAEIRDAFARKLDDSAQISAARPGVVVVNVQRLPRQGPVLTAGEIAELETMIAGKPYVRELLVSVPGPSGRTLLRVGARDSGLGIARGTVR